MRVLLIEDNEFNAFCLRRLLESVVQVSSITVVNNSSAALTSLYSHPFDLVIIDGNLGVKCTKDSYCNGPELAHIIFYKYSQINLIAWTDSLLMRKEFSQVFALFDRTLNELNLWDKMVSLEAISKTWAYYGSDFLQAYPSTYGQNRTSVLHRV